MNTLIIILSSSYHTNLRPAGFFWCLDNKYPPYIVGFVNTLDVILISDPLITLVSSNGVSNCCNDHPLPNVLKKYELVVYGPFTIMLLWCRK